MSEHLTFIRGAEPSPLVTIGDVAIRCRQKHDTVKHWAHRSPDIPEPVARTVNGAIYWWPEWVEWVRLKRPAIYTAMGNGATLESGASVSVRQGPPCESSLVDSCADCECTAEECELREAAP